MTLLMADLVQAVRYDLNDTNTSHLVRDEVPSRVIDGSNTVFYLRYFPIVGTNPGTDVVLTKDGALYTNFTIDPSTGKVTLSVAPTASLKANYYFYVFTDAEIESWISSGVEYCGGSVSSLTPVVPGIMFDYIQHTVTAGEILSGSIVVPWNKATIDKVVHFSAVAMLLLTSSVVAADNDNGLPIYDGANITIVTAVFGGLVLAGDLLTIFIVYRS